MTQQHSVLILVCVLAVVLTACGPGSATPAAYRHLKGPNLVASADPPSASPANIMSAWEHLNGLAVDLEHLGRGAVLAEGADEIVGFEPYNDPRIALSDGRFVVIGRWEGDHPNSEWYQFTSHFLVPGREKPGIGEENPVSYYNRRPVRLFVYDPGSGSVLPISHIPDVQPYQFGTGVGEAAEAVIAVVVLTGEHVVAYLTGYRGAAYDLFTGVYVAPIPPWQRHSPRR